MNCPKSDEEPISTIFYPSYLSLVYQLFVTQVLMVKHLVGKLRSGLLYPARWFRVFTTVYSET